MTRDEAIKAIRAGLRARSDKPWSVTGGRGTASGWLKITAPPRRLGCSEACVMEPTDCRDCGRNYLEPAHPQHVCPSHVCGDGCYTAYVTPTDRAALAALLGLDSVHQQGVSIPDASDYYREYIDRAEGRTPSAVGSPYWD